MQSYLIYIHICSYLSTRWLIRITYCHLLIFKLIWATIFECWKLEASFYVIIMTYTEKRHS